MNRIDELKEEIKDLRKQIETFRIDPDDYEDSYREMLDEYPVQICSLEYSASYVLEQVDPTAYRCGLNDYADGIPKDDDPKYVELQEELEDLETELELELGNDEYLEEDD
jgi:hypothetical protein